PQAYELVLADSYNNLAILYSKTQRLAESEEMHKAAIAIRERLAKDNPQAYEPVLADSYNHLAILYYDTQRFAESEEMHKAAIAIRERLAIDNPQAYELVLADSYNNLAILYSKTQRLAESEEIRKASIVIRERLAKDNPQIYKTQLMASYYWLGLTMLLEEKIHEAQEPFKQSLNLARQQVKAGKDTSLYCESLYYLSQISATEKDYASAYTYNEELLPILHVLYQGDSDKYLKTYLDQLVNRSFYANLLGKFKEGEQYSLEAIKVDSTKHIAYTNLAAALLLQGEVEEAEKLYRQYKAEYKHEFLSDFAEFERLGVIPEEREKDVERFKAMLNEE
ncbi:MAG: tetratricopeptide repeat protein, partial [Prevotella sp.]|nr:tetratricopeptide repeat protein [Prevotella sp.]